MDVQYSPEVRGWAEGAPLLGDASDLLAVAVGPKRSQEVKAEWTRVRDTRGRTLYRLTIRDPAGEAFTDFTPDQLRNPVYVRISIYRLWGDLLKIHSDIQHERVQTLFEQFSPAQEER